MPRRVRRDRVGRRTRHLARRAGRFDLGAVVESAAKAAAVPASEAGSGRRNAVPKGARVGDVRPWVPIGPAVVRGLAQGERRASGRIRDLALTADGRRGYAASALGGVWYTEDAGATWTPVGGWAERRAETGGPNHAQACGSILVDFGLTAGDDFVMVGTGETTPDVGATGGLYGGLGVFAATGPAAAPLGANPWEAEAGQSLLEGHGTYRLVRDPVVAPGRVGDVGVDAVLAATSAGLFLGTRVRVPEEGDEPEHDAFDWGELPGVDALVNALQDPPDTSPAITDVLWLQQGSDGRIVVAINGLGVAFSDDRGVSFTWLDGCGPDDDIQHRTSLANPDGTTRLYVLSALPQSAPTADVDDPPADTPTLWLVENMLLPAPVAVTVDGVPLFLWGDQGDYDQAITVEPVGAVDRVYLGGSFHELDGPDAAGLWCFHVDPSVPAPVLAAAPGVSRTGDPAPPGMPGIGDGADVDGLIGNGVHPDVHRICLTGPPAARQVWVGCDGGVSVSTRGGRVNTFATRSTGLSALEPGFVACHPTSSHFVASGYQDNGTQVRSGDTMWELVLVGDGGGVAFHPRRSEYIVAQYTNATWSSVPERRFVDPITREPWKADSDDREDEVSAFYSGASAVAVSPTVGRIALGTNRVWITDNLGTAAENRWRVLPYPDGGLTDPRRNGNDVHPRTGVPVGGGLGNWVDHGDAIGPLGPVSTVRWASPTELLALFQSGLVRWVEDPPGHWVATVLEAGGPFVSGALGTDIFPVPESRDLYLTTTGDPDDSSIDTCYLYDDAAGALVPAGLRQSLDDPVTGALGPLEPAYSVVVDPAVPEDVYVGTVTGVWRGARTPATTNVTWPRPPFVNGLPQAAVQDLSIWTDPTAAADSPRLLRAAVQARGIWEVDLAADEEPPRTYVRVHQRDDRRRFPTSMANPRRRTTAAEEPVFESPDITVRPHADPAQAPRWLLGGGRIDHRVTPAYELWTFQTAFRWTYPSVVPHGLWSDAFADLVELDRASRNLPAGRFIDRGLWDVVLGTRLAADGSLSGNAAHPLAVYRPAWQTPLSMQAAATEVDLLETVQPRAVSGGMWRVFSEPSTVEVLLHHRDTRPVPAGSAFAMLLWRSGPSGAALVRENAAGIVDFARDRAGGGVAHAVPAGWTLATATSGGALNPLTVSLDARLPRAVSIDVNLTGIDAFHRVLFLAIVGSTVDMCSAAPVGLPASPTVSDLVRSWPHAALRLVSVMPRP